MRVFVIIKLFTILFSISSVDGKESFYVEKSGYSRVTPGEITVVFYMTVANGGKKTVKIHSKNIQCCWVHPRSNSEYDCESMDLLGGIPVTLDSSKTGNITYIFTNLYPMDRVGRCIFHLWHEDRKIAHTIRFNTTYVKQTSWLGSVYKKITGQFDEDKTCDTWDLQCFPFGLVFTSLLYSCTLKLDPRRNCKPVNCVQKYNGKRNYFRKATKLCEPVYECHTKIDEENLPTTAFDKDHNRCKSLIQNKLTKEEEQHLKTDVEKNMDASQKKKFRNIDASDPIPIKCNHGKRVGSICVCDEGWKTDTSKVPLGDPKFVYNWCNVKTRKRPFLPYKHQKHFMITGLSLTSFTLLVAWFWMLHRYFYQKDNVDQSQAQKTVTTKSLLEDRSKLKLTTQLIEELKNKNILKKRSEAFVAGQLSTTRVSEKSIAGESDSSKTELLKDTPTRSLVNDESAISVKSKAVQKGRSTIRSARQSAKSLSTVTLPSGEGISKLGDISASLSRKKSPKSLSTYSLAAGEASNVSFSGKLMKEDKGSTSFADQTSKGHSTYSLGGEARNTSFFGQSTPEYSGTMTSASQIMKERSTFSSPGEASNVSLSGKSMKDVRRTMLSDSPITKYHYSAAGGASNISFTGKFTEEVRGITSPESEILTDHFPYSLLSEASGASLTGQRMKVDGSTISLRSPSRKGHSIYSLNGKDNSPAFTGTPVSVASNASQSLKGPTYYSVSGDKSSTISLANKSSKEKQGTLSWSQTMGGGASDQSRLKDSRNTSPIKGSGPSQDPMVIPMYDSSSDSY